MNLQTADDARQLVASFYPELGKPLPERSYADECTLYTPGHPDGAFHNFIDKMDVFVVCHLFGWVVKVSERGVVRGSIKALKELG